MARKLNENEKQPISARLHAFSLNMLTWSQIRALRDIQSRMTANVILQGGKPSDVLFNIRSASYEQSGVLEVTLVAYRKNDPSRYDERWLTIGKGGAIKLLNAAKWSQGHQDYVQAAVRRGLNSLRGQFLSVSDWEKITEKSN